MSAPPSDMGERLAALAGLRPWWPLAEPTPRWIRVRLGVHLVAGEVTGLAGVVEAQADGDRAQHRRVGDGDDGVRRAAVGQAARERDDAGRDRGGVVPRRRGGPQPVLDPVRRGEEAREERRRQHVVGGEPWHLLGERLGGAHHVHPRAGEVEVRVAQREGDLRAGDAGAGGAQAFADPGRRLLGAAGGAGQQPHRAERPEPAAGLRRLPPSLLGDGDVAAVRGHLAVTEQDQPGGAHFDGSGSSTSRTRLSRSAQAARNWRSVLRVAPKSWNSPIAMPSGSKARRKSGNFS